MKTPYEKNIFFCSCFWEALAVFRIDWEGAPTDIEIAFWKYGLDIPYTLKEKWKAIKYILKKGHPYSDMVVMHTETARAFANAIVEACDKPEED